MLDKVFLQTRVLISRAKNTYPFLEAELVSSSNVSSFAFKLSTFLYIYTYTRVKNYGIKETGCDKYGKTQYHCHVNLRNSWPEFSYFRWKKIIATAIRRNSLSPQTLLYRFISADNGRYEDVPFSFFNNRRSRISFPRFDLIPSVWKERSFLSLEARNRCFVRKYKRGGESRFVSKIIPLNTE